MDIAANPKGYNPFPTPVRGVAGRIHKISRAGSFLSVLFRPHATTGPCLTLRHWEYPRAKSSSGVVFVAFGRGHSGSSCQKFSSIPFCLMLYHSDDSPSRIRFYSVHGAVAPSYACCCECATACFSSGHHCPPSKLIFAIWVIYYHYHLF